MNTPISSTTRGAATFGDCNQHHAHLFRLNPGICAEEALEHASVLMGCANTITQLGGLEHGSSTLAWAAHYLGDMAKAIVDDVALGLQVALHDPADQHALNQLRE